MDKVILWVEPVDDSCEDKFFILVNTRNDANKVIAHLKNVANQFEEGTYLDDDGTPVTNEYEYLEDYINELGGTWYFVESELKKLGIEYELLTDDQLFYSTIQLI